MALLIALAILPGCEEKPPPPLDEATERELVADEARSVRAARQAAHDEVEASLEESRQDMDEHLPAED